MAIPAPGSVAMTARAPDVNVDGRRQQGIYTIFGSLTTAFTPSPGCNQVHGMQAVQPNLYWGATCKNISIIGQGSSITINPAQACYPDGFASFLSGVEMFSTMAFFSPGLACPSGWTATGLITFGMKNPYTADIGDEAATSVLKSGETIVRCCPTGYTYDDTNGPDLCVSALPSMTAITTSGFDNDCNDKVTTLTYPRGGYYADARAYPLHLIVPANTTFTPPLPTLAHDIPQAVKIVVGIAVPLGVIFLVILSFLGRKLYKRKKSKQQNAGVPSLADHSGRPEYSGKAELEADKGGAMARTAGTPFEKPELDHHGPQVSPRPELEAVQGPSEMDGGQVAYPSELPPHAASTQTRSELHGNSYYARLELDASTAPPRSSTVSGVVSTNQ